MASLLRPLGVEIEQDARGYPEVQADTLAEVADAGARHLLAADTPRPFLLEDAGLFVAALRGFPGVYSAYALQTIGCLGVLRLMQDIELEQRTAAFEARLVYVDEDGGLHAFAGRAKGRIADRQAGTEGFGFDPIFVPEGHEKTFAQLSSEEKGRISHRGRAAGAFIEWIGKSASISTKPGIEPR